MKQWIALKNPPGCPRRHYVVTLAISLVAATLTGLAGLLGSGNLNVSAFIMIVALVGPWCILFGVALESRDAYYVATISEYLREQEHATVLGDALLQLDLRSMRTTVARSDGTMASATVRWAPLDQVPAVLDSLPRNFKPFTVDYW